MGLLFSRQLKSHPTTIFPQKLRLLFASRGRCGVPDLFISRHACTKAKRSSPNV